MRTLALFVVLVFWVGCSTDTQDSDDSINVGFRVYSHNLPRNATGVSIRIEKETNDGTVKGKFDLSGSADIYGDYKSNMAVSYNLHDRGDKIHVHYNYTLSQYHGGSARQGTETIGYAELVSYDGGVYEVDLEYADSDVQWLWNGWNEYRDRMTFCYDLPYLYLNGYPPASGENADTTKAKLYTSLLANGYVKSLEGGMNSSTYLEDGDIVMFGLFAVPNPKNAQHYAVFEDGKLWQIMHWSNSCGEFDGPRDISFFIYRPSVQNPCSGAIVEPPNPYLYCMVFSKQKTLPDG